MNDCKHVGIAWKHVLDTLSVIADGPSTQEEGQAAADDGGLEQADED